VLRDQGRLEGRISAERLAAMAERSAVEKDRKIRRVERIGELVEEIFWIASAERELDPDPRSWWPLRNRLGQTLVGLKDKLPKCAELLNLHLSGQAFGAASQARIEVETELKFLHGELIRPT
jgi:hypothetical protein